MAKKRPVSNNTGRNKIETAGDILIGIGIIGTILSIIIFIIGIFQPPEPESLIYLFISVTGVVISFLVSGLGIILYLIVRSQEKKRRAFHTSDDSQSE